MNTSTVFALHYEAI